MRKSRTQCHSLNQFLWIIGGYCGDAQVLRPCNDAWQSKDGVNWDMQASEITQTINGELSLSLVSFNNDLNACLPLTSTYVLRVLLPSTLWQGRGLVSPRLTHATILPDF